MSETRSQPQNTALRLPQICAGVAAGIAVLALAGWLTGVRFLAGQWDIYKPMAPLSALALLLLGSALFCQARWPAQRLSRRFTLVAAGLVSLAGLLVLGQFLTGVDLGVERALSRTNELLGQTPLGRMSPLSAIAFLLEGAALFLLLIASRWRNAPTAAALLAVSASGINLVVLMGYAYGAPLLYGGPIIPVSLPTAIAFVLVGVGEIALAAPGVTVWRAWSGASLRGRLLRAFLPVMLLLIFVEGWLAVAVVPSLIPNHALWHSLAAVAAGLLIAVISGWIAGRTGDAIEQAQAALRESEDRYRQLVELSPDTIAVHSEGKIVFINTAGAILLGAANPEQLIGKPILDFVHPEYRGIVKERVRQMAEEGKAVPLIEEKFIRLDGTMIDVEVAAVPFTYRGKPAVQAVVRDITERKQAEEALHRSEDHYRRLVESSGDMVFSLDRAGVFHTAGGARLQEFGLTSKDLVGRPLYDIFPEEEARRYQQKQLQVFEGGTAITYESTFEFAGLTKTDLTTIYPIAGRQGEIELVGVVCRDITERKRAEQALRESEEKYRLLVETSPDGIGMAGVDGRLVLANRQLASLFSYAEPAEMRGLSLFELFAPEERARAHANFGSTLQRGSVQDSEHVMVRRDGTRFHGVISRAVVRAANGAPRALIGLVRDITERKRAEAALRESERKLKLIAENTSDTIFAYDMQRRLIYVNPAVKKLTGYGADELYERNFINWLHPDDEARAMQLWDGLYEGQGYVNQEFRIVTKSGQVKWCLGSWGALYDENGQQIGAQGRERDITERKRAEESLRKEKMLNDSIIDNMPAGIAFLDNDFVLRKCNRAYEALIRTYTPYSPEQALGMSYFDYVPGSREQVEEWFTTVRDSGQSETRYGFKLVIKRDGEETTYWDTSIAPVFGSTGNVEGILILTQDVTERMHTEEALAAERTLLRTLVDNLPDAVYVKDLAGRKTLTNPMDILKIGAATEAEVLGKTDFELFPLDLATAFTTADQRVLQTGQPLLNREERITLPDGSQGWQLTSKVPLRDGAGQIIGLVGIGRDITERKQAEDRLHETLTDLQRSNADLQQFAYVASHDLQEPLRMVASYVQLLGMRYQGQLDADADEFIGYAVEGATRMQQLLLDLLEYSRVGTRGSPLQPTDVTAVCQDALQDLEIALAENHATVVCDPLPTVLADASQLRQLFQNLIANAIKFHGAEPPHVRISARQTFEVSETSKVSAEVWEFAVCDNGIGIEPQYFERIFVIFQRLHTRRAYAGTGIGLAICKKIVERHGGRIWVESAPEQGTTFYFTLPAAA